MRMPRDGIGCASSIGILRLGLKPSFRMADLLSLTPSPRMTTDYFLVLLLGALVNFYRAPSLVGRVADIFLRAVGTLGRARVTELAAMRSEERRVGKECRSWWTRDRR